ncbi:MAG: CRISPR-associated endonuclease Cas1 [Elusimicrobiota bacterium]|jgi:CRISPR-associated protein Cas1|nr:CRISPR-associated endonuclease Cas1 [Elusimicrobiota bacterium]
MQLIINTYGAYISKKDKCFLVKIDGETTEISCKKISQILLTNACALSSDAIQLAIENNIDIVFLDETGFPYARVWYPKIGSTTYIRRRQLELSFDEEGFKLAKNWIIRKLENQIDFFNDLAMNRREKTREIYEYRDRLRNIIESIDGMQGTLEELRGILMGYEGNAGRIYFEGINFIIHDRFKFDGRSRQPAKDEFNALLNYSYGVLYSMVEKACIIAGLDPYIGFLHTDNYNKKSLVFDLIELFRIYADKTVLYLFSSRKVKQEYFDKIFGGISLNKEGKKLLMEHFNKNFDETIRYNGRNIKVRDSIQFECHKIANDMIKNDLKENNN